MEKLVDALMAKIGGKLVGDELLGWPLFDAQVIVPHLNIKLSEINAIIALIEGAGFEVVDVEISEFFNIEYWVEEENQTTLTFTLLTPKEVP